MPYGTVNADVIGTSVAGANLGAGNASIMKNRIINGAMTINQRGFSGNLTTAGTQLYTLDRWLAVFSLNDKYSISQNAGSVTPPVGFSNYLGVTSLAATSVGTSEYFMLRQWVEGFNFADCQWGTANAKTLTLSFWVRSSLTGTFGGSFMNSAEDRFYPFNYTISSANTWEQKTITVAGDTSGTWIGATNGKGVGINFALGLGTSYLATANAWTSSLGYAATGATSVVGTSGATFYITGVQLEVGSSATGFEYVNYQTSLANCQRYYAKMSSAVTYAGYGAGYNSSTSQANFYIKYPTTMRSAPTINQNNLLIITGTGVSVSGIGSTYAGTDAATIAANASSSTLTTYQGAVLSQNSGGSGYLDFSAEL